MKTNNTKNKHYFSELDGLRFLAFFGIFSTHFFNRHKINSTGNQLLDNFYYVILNGGWVGVELFFVLSGFLITYIIIIEKRKYKNFSLKNFMMRRVLRIWPLYYLAVLVGFFLVPYIAVNFFSLNYPPGKLETQRIVHLPFFLLFFGNWSLIFNGIPDFRNIPHLWTISIEEQFYILWPLTLYFCKSFKHLLVISIALLCTSLISRGILVLNNISDAAIYMNTFTRLDPFTIGGMIAIIYLYRPQFLKKINFLFNNSLVFLFTLVLGVYLKNSNLLTSSSIFESIMGYLAIDLYMGYILIYVICHQGPFQRFLNLKIIVWLGGISYGLYVWHRLGTDIISILIPPSVPILIRFLMALFITGLIGFISYNYFEKYFLKFKTKFTRVQTKSIH